MDLKKFIQDFSEILEETDFPLDGTTRFKDLEEWSSIVALSLIAMVDENYNVVLKGTDIQNVDTLEALYRIVLSKR